MKTVLGITVLVLLAVIILQWKCGGKEQPAAKVVNVDSLQAIIKAQANKITADSLDYADFKRLDDSVHRAMIAAKAQIEKAGTKQIVALTFEVNKFKAQAAAKDTSGGFETCIRISELYDSAKIMLAIYKATVDSLEANHTGRTERDSLQIATLYQSINSLQRQVDYLLAEIRELVTQNEELRAALAKSKKGKKWLTALGFIGGAVISGAVLK